MLDGIDPLLTPELLGVLAAMGHGDDLVIADGNFPGERLARRTVHGRPIWLAGASVPSALQAVLSLFPLDTAVTDPLRAMATDDGSDELPAVQQESQAVLDRMRPGVKLTPVERFAFYDLATAAYAIVMTSEVRPWANLAVRKGVSAGRLS